MIEDELRAAFERQEAVVPEAAPVRARIDFAWVRLKRRRAKRRALGAAAAVLLAGAVVPVVSTTWVDLHASALEGQADLIKTEAPISGPIDVLLIGSDRRADTTTERANTVMLLHVPADRSAVYMLSLPRDGLVDVPGKGRQKLDAALALGGPGLIRSTVAKLTGVEPGATVTVDITAAEAVTDEVGGVTMCLDQAIPAQQGRKGLARGCQHIDGDDVAAVLLGRDGLKRASLDRDRNNQLFLRALATKLVADGMSPALISRVLSAGGDDHVRVDGIAIDALLAVREIRTLIGLGEPVFHSTADGEIVDSAEWKSLYQALREDQLARWVAANPRFVTE
ncbi:LCP family protein [Actinoplanes sp. NPDC020271]|uniref:LCP family protein n=1 Tax=Actinoplanes sp. NPDC020271 TaxID=3363896 RepID=UPI003793D5AA